MLAQKIFAPPDSFSRSLSDLSVALLEQQKSAWPQLAEGYAALASIRLRDIDCEGFSVRLQFNPRRIVSSGARVDPQSIKERKCFLCLENLPEAQKGVLCRDEFLVLCNPAPIFTQHYTISNINHIPQEIEKFAGVFLSLARDLSPRFTVFYNGPKCGASAPDHMHFQACPGRIIPVETEAADNRRRVLRKHVGDVTCSTLTGYGREVIVLESANASQLETQLLHLIGVMKNALATIEEPMLNILCSYQGGGWRVIVFPRRKHRPEVYFREGDAKVLISPASVDIGGLIITPIEKDFLRVDAAMVRDIFTEVSVERGFVDTLIDSL